MQTQEQVNNFSSNLAIVIGFTIQKLPPKMHLDFVDVTQKALAVSNGETVGAAQLAEAVFDVLDELTDLTETKADDKAVALAETVYTILTGTKPLKAWIDKIRERRKAKKERRKAKKDK